MKTILKIVLAIIIATVLIVGGCSVLLGGAIDNATKNAQKNAITRAEFRSVKQGTPIAAVKKRFGKPTDQQVTQTKGYNSRCIYYPIKGSDFGNEYQFCFDNGKLSSKAKY